MEGGEVRVLPDFDVMNRGAIPTGEMITKYRKTGPEIPEKAGEIEFGEYPSARYGICDVQLG